MSAVTQLLEAAGHGKRDAEEQSLKLVYAELHGMAESKLAGDWTFAGRGLMTNWGTTTPAERLMALSLRCHQFGMNK